MKLSAREMFELQAELEKWHQRISQIEYDKTFHAWQGEVNKAIAREIDTIRNKVICEKCREAVDKFYLDGSL